MNTADRSDDDYRQVIHFLLRVLCVF